MELFLKINDLLPERYVAFDLLPASESGLLRVCLVGDRRDVSPVELFSSSLSTVYLGVVLDRSGVIRQKLEIVVESRRHISGSFDSRYATLSNDILDQQWIDFTKGLLSSPGMIRSPHESVPARPLLLDFDNETSQYLLDEQSGEEWQLCQDNQALAAAGFDSYGSSLTRFLYVPENPASGFIDVATDGGEPQAKTIKNVLKPDKKKKVFNEQSGRFLILNRKDLTFNEYDTLLSDLPLSEDDLPSASVVTEEKFKKAGGLNGRLFTAHNSTQVNYGEILHLKLSALADISKEVQKAVISTGIPMFNISDDSFAVNIHSQGKGLPYLWSASVELVRPGCGVACTLPGSDDQLFINPERQYTSVFKPKSVGGKQKGEATLNFHQVLNDVDNSLQLAGTLRVSERIDLDKTDMVWIRLMNSGLRVDIFCDVDDEQAADGVRHFSTKMRSFSKVEKAWLLENLGIPLNRTYWEVVPVASSPYDLYSLGVVFVSSLLSNKDQSLGVSLDHVLHLAQKCCEEGVTGELADTIEVLFAQEEQFWHNLGPQLLTNEGHVSSQYIPKKLWFKVLALVLKMFPGFAGVSHVNNLADVRGSLSSVFDKTITETNSLTELTRFMLLGNWDLNLEVSQVLKKFK